MININNNFIFQNLINENRLLVIKMLTKDEVLLMDYYIEYYKIDYYNKRYLIEYFIYFILNSILFGKKNKKLCVQCCFNDECYSLAVNAIPKILKDRYPNIKLELSNNKLTINNF